MAQDIGIDLGTASVLVYIKGKGIVLKEPSVVAVDTTTNRLLAVGLEAQRMLGRTPGNIVAIRPLREGVISDYQMTERMLKYFLERICKRQLFKPRVIICVPSGVTEVEERAVMDAASQAGASKVYLIEEPVAAAIGANIDISKPYGNMVVDIGGGTTDIAVISLGGIVESNSIKIAGDKFDEAIVKYIRKKHNVLVGERTAEDIKMRIGCVIPRENELGKKETLQIETRGRCLITGLPKEITVSSDEVCLALEECSNAITEAIKNLLETTPPELIGDIATHGIVLTGGGALIWGLDKLIHAETGIPCYVADDAISCVAVGTGKALENIESLKDTMDKRRRIS
ncbi:MAG: rod shape-determining protein MreB [Clostridiales bacterium]|jgi:rod shape-determining protein MreB|nr:rod shape-determining protein MreB [Clostridiales bacterium]